MKKKPFKYVLSVDFGRGDGPDYFPITKKNWKKDLAYIEEYFPAALLFSSYPPPKGETLCLTKKQWESACRSGRDI